MFFSKERPVASAIANEKKYMARFVEYSDELAFFRKLIGKNVFAGPSIRGTLRELRNYPNPDALSDRLTELAIAYHTKLKPLIDARGGLHRCPSKITGVAAKIMLNMAVIQEMLTKRHKHAKRIKLPNKINGKS